MATGKILSIHQPVEFPPSMQAAALALEMLRHINVSTLMEFFEWSNRDKRLDDFSFISLTWPTGVSNTLVLKLQ